MSRNRTWWEVIREIRRYAVGRTISTGLGQEYFYLDVVLVGVLAGSAAAGVYGGAVRFVAAGLIAEVAIRVRCRASLRCAHSTWRVRRTPSPVSALGSLAGAAQFAGVLHPCVPRGQSCSGGFRS